jgi:hypothetical protein
MGSNLLTVGSTVSCTHEGQAQPLTFNPRVRADGQAVVTQLDLYTVAGCVSTSPPPCVKAQWLTAATRVRAGGQPVLLQDSQALCESNSTPLKVMSPQSRVSGV